MEAGGATPKDGDHAGLDGFVWFFGVVGVFITTPIVKIVKILRHIPLAQRGNEWVKPLNSHLRCSAALPARRRRHRGG